MRRTVAAVSACAAALTFSVAQASSAEASDGCAPNFDLLTIDQSAELIVEEGYPDSIENVSTALLPIDKNGDSLLCLYDFRNTKGNPSYVFNLLDNRLVGR